MKIGVLGAGQLGRMLAEAASVLGMQVVTFDAFENLEAVRLFIKQVDVITYEFENIPPAVLGLLEGCAAFPAPAILAMTQDRLSEKQKLNDLGLKTAAFTPVNTWQDLVSFNTFPCILKTRRLGYDGKGQVKINNPQELEKPSQELEACLQNACIVEAVVPFTCEVSVIVARGRDGSVACYDVVRTVHKNHILHETYVPSGLPKPLEEQARSMASRLVEALDYVGVMGIEMFYIQETNELIINELAPRVHNSGHWTQDGCLISQFEQHIRAVSGLPLGDVTRHSDVKMINLLGKEIEQAWQAYTQKDQHVHLYGKTEVREGRKMGHINIIRPKPFDA